MGQIDLFKKDFYKIEILDIIWICKLFVLSKSNEWEYYQNYYNINTDCIIWNNNASIKQFFLLYIFISYTSVYKMVIN